MPRDGHGCVQSMKTSGIRPIVTDIVAIDDAVKAYNDGSVVDHIDRLH